MNQEILLKVRKSQESMKAYKEGSLLLITTKLLITAKLKGKKNLGRNTMKLTGCTEVSIVFHMFVITRA